jgi:hypothetical protein
MSRTLRVLVTGQSPRPDVAAQIALGAPGVECHVAGALDGMSHADIKGSTQRCSDADILPAKLASGEITPVARGLVADRLSARLQTRGPTLLWSTASFLTLPRYDDVVLAGTLRLVVPNVSNSKEDRGTHAARCACRCRDGRSAIRSCRDR